MSTTPPPPPQEPTWYYLAGQQRYGPIPDHTMLAMVRCGGVTDSTLVWREGLTNWTPVHDVPEFTFVFPSVYAQSMFPSEASRRNPRVAMARMRVFNPGVHFKKDAGLGLTSEGLVLFIVLLVVCWPLCWLPWCFEGCRAGP